MASRPRSLRRGDLCHEFIYESFSFLYVMLYDTGTQQRDCFVGVRKRRRCKYCVIRCVPCTKLLCVREVALLLSVFLTRYRILSNVSRNLDGVV